MEVNQEGSWEEAGGSAEICCMVRIKKRLHHIILYSSWGSLILKACDESIGLRRAHARAPAQANARAPAQVRCRGADCRGCMLVLQGDWVSVRIPGQNSRS